MIVVLYTDGHNYFEINTGIAESVMLPRVIESVLKDSPVGVGKLVAVGVDTDGSQLHGECGIPPQARGDEDRCGADGTQSEACIYPADAEGAGVTEEEQAGDLQQIEDSQEAGGVS